MSTTSRQQIQTTIEQKKRQIETLRTSTFIEDKVFIAKQIEKHQQRIAELEEDLLDPEETLAVTEELLQESEGSSEEVKPVEVKVAGTKTEKSLRKSENRSQKRFKQNNMTKEDREDMRARDYSFRDQKWDRDCDRYFDWVAKTPKHLLSKLKDMPNNKGIIFRGIYFFGAQPAEQPSRDRRDRRSQLQPPKTVLFDYSNRDNMIIHEYFTTSEGLHHKQSSKNRNDRANVFISETVKQPLTMNRRRPCYA